MNITRWREFFAKVGVKNAPDNGVEDFAVNYALKEMPSQFRSLVRVYKRNHGYDVEGSVAKRTARIEVKGQTADHDVSLTENETKAAQIHGSDYFLFVVTGIPERPKSYLVKDPYKQGARPLSLVIPIQTWQSFPV